MAARSLSSATISFGLVAIPVKLFTTSESRASISFNWLHSCGTRVQQRYWCPRCEKLVERDDLVKGYEFAKGRYVTFTPEELRALDEASSESIDIHEFLPLSEVDPLYFDRAYYLGPDKGGAKPYRLLAEALAETGRAALASWAARGRQHLVLIRRHQDGLVLQQLRYADEIKSFDEIDRGDAKVERKEIELAVKLVDQLAGEAFSPEQYEDTVRARIEDAIRRKVEGDEAIAVEPPAVAEAQVIDLMEALRASLDGKAAPARGKRPRKAAESEEGEGESKRRMAKVRRGRDGKRARSS